MGRLSLLQGKPGTIVCCKLLVGSDHDHMRKNISWYRDLEDEVRVKKLGCSNEGVSRVEN